MNVTSLGGAKGGAVTSHMDITRHKLADIDDEMRRHQQEIKVLLDNSPDAFVRLDREGRFSYVNAITARVAGLPPQEFLGKTAREVGLPENLCDLWARTFRAVLDSGLPQSIE